MDFTVNVTNLPQVGEQPQVREVWWRASWLPQGLFGDWLESYKAGQWTFEGAESPGQLSIEVWGSWQYPEDQVPSWVPMGEINVSNLSPREGEVITVDFKNPPRAGGSGLLVGAVVVGALAAGALALSRR